MLISISFAINFFNRPNIARVIVEKVVCEMVATNGYDRQGARMGPERAYLISSSACSILFYFIFLVSRCDDGIAHELSFRLLREISFGKGAG